MVTQNQKEESKTLSPTSVREEFPMNELEASAHPESEALNLEELKTVEPVIERARKFMSQKQAQKRKIPGLSPEEIEEGEEHLMSLKRLKCRPPAYFDIPIIEGDLIMTNYKLVYKPTLFPEGTPTQKHLPTFLDDFFTVPLCLISRAEKKITEKKKENIKLGLIELTTKDYRLMIFDFEGRVDECSNTHYRINFFTFPEHDMQDIFAFKYTFSATTDIALEKELIEYGWGIWDPEREFDIDQGINFSHPTCV